MTDRIVQFQPQVQPKASSEPEPVAVPENATLEEKIIAAMRNVFDPEIPVNIYDLGLIYDIDAADPANVKVNMTLTSPHCPVAESLPAQVESNIRALEDVDNVCVNLVWDPPWDPERMSEEAKLLLDMY
ncbi:MAG: SUF system Fe-S cluster assembly protein [Gammaproteobacteria bacterium]|jgi:FeS assembly SUF system protein